MPTKKLHIKKGDMVMVLTGDYRGHKGKVLEVFPKKDRAIVQDARLVHKHTKPTNDNPDGGIIKQEAPIHVSNLAVLDPSSGEPTRIGRRRNENNKLVRYSKKSGEDI